LIKDLFEEKRAITIKWISKTRKNAQGEVSKYKAKTVGCGF